MRARPLVLVLTSYLVLGPCEDAFSVGPQPDREAQWRQDLDYLIKQLEITHPHPYANVSRADFLQHVHRLKSSISNSTDVDMFIGIQELVSKIRNVHTSCTPPLFWNTGRALKRQFQYYPVRYYPFDDGLYVASIAKQHKRILGKKVIQIGKLTSEEVMRALGRFVPADNHMTALANLPRWCLNDGQLLRHIGATDSADKITLRLEDDDGTSFDFTLATVPHLSRAFFRPFIESGSHTLAMNAESENALPLYMSRLGDNYWFRHLPEQDAIYLQINLLYDGQSESFERFCRRMFRAFDEKKARKLILDLRLNVGGDHIALPLLKAILARPDLDRPDRLFLIIGRLTGSAAQHLTSEMERYTNATLFGEPTASKPNQYGAMTRFNLPHSGLEMACATKYFQDALPSDYSMASTPHIFVPLTSVAFRNNQDPVLERVLGYDSYKDMRPAFFKALSEGYSGGGMAGLKETYNGLKEKYVQAGWNMEVLLYDDLDGWMGPNSRGEEDYIAFLEWIHGELPDSTKVSYDLAYWMNKIGKTAEALRLYDECLRLNPEHRRARWRRDLITLQEQWEAEH